MKFKLDLHTHSTASPDGGLKAEHYEKAIDLGLIDCVAVTDHNRIDGALALRHSLGDRIIVGEEILSSSGEIIGLFLDEEIPSGLTAEETIRRIKLQNGIVYIPHPFETIRKGLHPAILEELADQIDIIEICNGRAFMQNRSEQAVVWSRLNHVLGVSASDAHGFKGLGKTYMLVDEMPNRENFLSLISDGSVITDRPGLRALFYPKYNRFRKRLRGKK